MWLVLPLLILIIGPALFYLIFNDGIKKINLLIVNFKEKAKAWKKKKGYYKLFRKKIA